MKKGNIFNADRDNNGEGVPIPTFVQMLLDCDALAGDSDETYTFEETFKD